MKSSRLDTTRLESLRLVLVKVYSTYWKSSRERLSVKYTKDIGQGMKSRRLDSSRLESSRPVLVKVDSTYWKSSRERLSVKSTKDMG